MYWQDKPDNAWTKMQKHHPPPCVTCSSSYQHCCPHLVSSKGWVGLVIVSIRDGFGDERCTSSGIHSTCGLVIMASTVSTHTTGLPCQRDPAAVGQIKALTIIISFRRGRLGPCVCELLPSLRSLYLHSVVSLLGTLFCLEVICCSNTNTTRCEKSFDCVLEQNLDKWDVAEQFHMCI